MASREWENPETMLSVDEVLDRIISSIEPRPCMNVDLLEGRGFVLAEDVVASADVPPFANSAMDGYALRAADSGRGLPATFAVVGTIQAGASHSQQIESGQAARIMTGAPVPPGADAVVRFEEVREASVDRIEIWRTVQTGENIRLAGEDVRRGSVVLRKGAILRPAEIGLLAAIGASTVAVHRRPRIGIVSTGDEVVEPDSELKFGQIRDANSYLLAALVAESGALPVRLGIAADNSADLSDRLRVARACDLILTSGGVSHGDFDLVKDVMQQEGDVDLWTVRMKPGKPLAFGRIGETPLLGLPGNPAAAAVAFHQFGRPAILKMLGCQNILLPVIRARLTETVENHGRRRHFERGIVAMKSGEWQVRLTGIHGSAMLSGLSVANCYVVVPEDVSRAEAGEIVDVQLLGPEFFASLGTS